MEHSPSIALRKLSDTDLEVATRVEDVRGHKLVDRHGEEIGKIDELLVDEEHRKVRFLRVSAGGFLGLGASTFLVPVDAVTRVTAEQVHIDQTRKHIEGAPRYEPELVERREYFQRLYGYYGYSPYWGPGYVYPSYPTYGSSEAHTKPRRGANPSH